MNGDIDQNAKTLIAQIIDDTFESTDDFTNDIITSDLILKIVNQNLPILFDVRPTMRDIHQLLSEYGFNGETIPGTQEKLWKMKLKP